jgi:hypothetical protein
MFSSRFPRLYFFINAFGFYLIFFLISIYFNYSDPVLCEDNGREFYPPQDGDFTLFSTPSTSLSSMKDVGHNVSHPSYGGLSASDGHFISHPKTNNSTIIISKVDGYSSSESYTKNVPNGGYFLQGYGSHSHVNNGYDGFYHKNSVTYSHANTGYINTGYYNNEVSHNHGYNVGYYKTGSSHSHASHNSGVYQDNVGHHSQNQNCNHD